VVVGPGRSEILILGGLQQTSVAALRVRRKIISFRTTGPESANRFEVGLSASQPTPRARETAPKAVSTTEKCWVTPNLSASSATDVKPWQTGPFRR